LIGGFVFGICFLYIIIITGLLLLHPIQIVNILRRPPANTRVIMQMGMMPIWPHPTMPAAAPFGGTVFQNNY
jgi:hypothetical protein